jgi:hypothetical protein
VTRLALLFPFMTPFIAASLTACGSDGDSETPFCDPGEIAVRGTIDGAAEELRTTWKTYGFVNAFGGNGTFDAELTADGSERLHLEWPELVANGSVVEVRGTFETGALKIGNCLTGADFTGTMTVDDDGDGGAFVLRELAKPPYCGGSSVTGSLAGCYRNR